MKKEFKEKLQKMKGSHQYWADILTLELTEALFTLMEKKNLNQKQLSKVLKTSEAYISRVLNGQENMSISSIAKFANALDAAPHIHVAPKDKVVEFIERDSGNQDLEARFEYKILNAPDVFGAQITSVLSQGFEVGSYTDSLNPNNEAVKPQLSIRH